jgi:hypothetical protein
VRTTVPSLVRTCGGELQVQLLQQLVFSIGLDYLLARVWTILSAIVGALSLEEDVLHLVWLSSLGFASGVILSQG